MAQVIVRIYATAEKAASAVKDVKALGYGDSEVFVCGPSAGATKADLVAGLGHAGLAKAEAESCADEVLKGRTVVAAHAAFGGGAKVAGALDKYDPIAAPATTFTKPAGAKKAASAAAGPSDTTFKIELNDDATPLSNYLKWPVLLSSPTPFSDYFKFPVLSEFKTKLELSDDPAPLSKKMGWELLKNDPTPLSTKMGWAVLKD